VDWIKQNWSKHSVQQVLVTDRGKSPLLLLAKAEQDKESAFITCIGFYLDFARLSSKNVASEVQRMRGQEIQR
jgi:hypothetical protein